MHEDSVLLNVDMSSAFSVVASSGRTTPKAHGFEVIRYAVDNGVLRPKIDLAGPCCL